MLKRVTVTIAIIIVAVLAIMMTQPDQMLATAMPGPEMMNQPEHQQVCGKWGWPFPPPPDSSDNEIDEWILNAWDEIEYHGCDACGNPNPDTTLEHVIHWIFCGDRPEDIDLEYLNIPIYADEVWIRQNTPYWN